MRDRSKNQTEEAKQHVRSLITYCRKIGPYVYFHKQQIRSLNETAHHILKNKVDLILPQFPARKEKRCIFTSLITGFIGLAYEGISSFLHNRRHKALHKSNGNKNKYTVK